MTGQQVGRPADAAAVTSSRALTARLGLTTGCARSRSLAEHVYVREVGSAASTGTLVNLMCRLPGAVR